MRLQRVAKPFDNSDYIFELKHDGFRAIAYIEDHKCKLVSRNPAQGIEVLRNLFAQAVFLQMRR
jgi:hypothetical protein